MIYVLIALVLVAGAVFYFISVYNRFQELKNGASATLGQIKVALKKRLDMLSQLLDTVQSYAKFEQSTLEKITELRSKVLDIESPKDIDTVDKEIKAIAGNILVSVEAYPELQTSKIVKDLTSSIKDIENEISRHRYTYNNIVQEYNTMIDTIPSNIVASLSGFKKKEYLEFEKNVEDMPVLKWTV